MDFKVTTLDGQDAGSVTLNKDIFGLEPRNDLIQRCVVWQLAKRRAGTHAVKKAAPKDLPKPGKFKAPAAEAAPAKEAAKAETAPTAEAPKEGA